MLVIYSIARRRCLLRRCNYLSEVCPLEGDAPSPQHTIRISNRRSRASVVCEAFIGSSPRPHTRSMLGEKIVHRGQKLGITAENEFPENRPVFILHRAPPAPLFGERASLFTRHWGPVPTTGKLDGLVGLGEMRDRLCRGVIPIAGLERIPPFLPTDDP